MDGWIVEDFQAHKKSHTKTHITTLDNHVQKYGRGSLNEPPYDLLHLQGNAFVPKFI